MIAGAPAIGEKTEKFDPKDLIIRTYDANGAVVAATAVDINAVTPANGKTIRLCLVITT